jgi:transposase
MNKLIMAQNEEIVMGVDVSDRKHNVAAVRYKGGEIVHECRVAPEYNAWKKYLSRFPGCAVTVVYESGPQGYNLHDAIEMFGHKAVVVAPVKHVGGVKTDKRDARSIARDYLAGRARVVTVPDIDKREARQLLRLRHQFVKDLTRTRNRMSAMVRFHGLTSRLFVFGARKAGKHLAFCLETMARTEAFHQEQISRIDAQLAQLAAQPQYSPIVDKLTPIKGIGRLTALEIALEVADIGKFRNSEAFASYTGLCPGEWSTGQTRRQGHITRQGPGRLRGALVRSAWSQVRCDEQAKARFEALASRTGRKRAIVAMARRLAVTVWWTLRQSEQQAA